jgi:Conserved TM helix
MDNLSFYLEPLRAFLYQLGAYVPRLVFAALVVVAGWLIAKVARFAVIRGLRAINFPVLTERAGIDNFLRQGGMVSDSTVVFGALAYWMVILVSLVIAFNGLGLSYVTDLLGRVMWFVPNIFVALLILAFGAYFAKFVADAVNNYGRNVGMQDTLLLAKAAQYAILLFVVLIALDQIKVGGDIVRESFLIILGGVVFALALAFGLAGKDWAADRIEQWWPRSRNATRRAAAPTPAVREPLRRDSAPAPLGTPPASAWPARSTTDERPHP